MAVRCTNFGAVFFEIQSAVGCFSKLKLVGASNLSEKYDLQIGSFPPGIGTNIQQPTIYEISFSRNELQADSTGKLVGGWTNPFEKYARQNGNLPQFSGLK